MKKTEIIKTLKANKNINGFELICTNKDSLNDLIHRIIRENLY